MIDDGYTIAITALLPLTAALLVVQVNPYHALVIRGILGAIAALVYALFGAADVALTEALVGTMLSITLYAIAVRSSMTVRIGVVDETSTEETSAEETSAEETPTSDDKPSKLTSKQLLSELSPTLSKYHVRLELFTYPTPVALAAALTRKEIHMAYGATDNAPASLQTRIQRLYDILNTALPATLALAYINPVNPDASRSQPSGISNLTRSQP